LDIDPLTLHDALPIFNSLKEAMGKRMAVSSVTMSVALATGLYATHTFVPPTPGPIAAAGNLGLESNLGLVIAVGLIVAIPATLARTLWSQLFRHVEPDLEPDEDLQELLDGDWEDLKSPYGQLPTAAQSFPPILVPILLIAIGSLTELPGDLVGEGAVASVITFLGNPMTALTV